MVWILVGGFRGKMSKESGKEGQDGLSRQLLVLLDCFGWQDDRVGSTEVWQGVGESSFMLHGISDGVQLIEDVEWSAENLWWDGSEPEGETVKDVSSDAIVVERNDIDENQFGSAFGLGRLRWVWMGLKGKTDSTKFDMTGCVEFGSGKIKAKICTFGQWVPTNTQGIDRDLSLRLE